MEQFSQIVGKNSFWKIFLGLNKIPYDFPQVKFGFKKLPLVFFSQGYLTLFERQLEYRANEINSLNKYDNLKENLFFEIDYNLLKAERFLHPRPFMEAVNIPWIKLSITDNSPFDHILLSFGGDGITMKQVEETNNKIFEILAFKTNSLNR
jgi:hypothetical protein